MGVAAALPGAGAGAKARSGVDVSPASDSQLAQPCIVQILAAGELLHARRPKS